MLAHFPLSCFPCFPIIINFFVFPWRNPFLIFLALASVFDIYILCLTISICMFFVMALSYAIPLHFSLSIYLHLFICLSFLPSPSAFRFSGSFLLQDVHSYYISCTLHLKSLFLYLFVRTLSSSFPVLYRPFSDSPSLTPNLPTVSLKANACKFTRYKIKVLMD